jgi:hypothetical protein
MGEAVMSAMMFIPFVLLKDVSLFYREVRELVFSKSLT